MSFFDTYITEMGSYFIAKVIYIPFLRRPNFFLYPVLILWQTVLWIRIRNRRIHMFLGLLDPDPDPLVRGMDPDFLSLKSSINVPSKSNETKNLFI